MLTAIWPVYLFCPLNTVRWDFNTPNTCNQALQQLKPCDIARHFFCIKITFFFLFFKFYGNKCCYQVLLENHIPHILLRLHPYHWLCRFCFWMSKTTNVTTDNSASFSAFEQTDRLWVVVVVWVFFSVISFTYVSLRWFLDFLNYRRRLYNLLIS